MVTTKIMDKKQYKKPIIMPRNPARGQMPYDLAVADDLAAIEKAKQLDAYEEKLDQENKEKLQAKADEMFPVKADPSKQEVVEEAPKVEEPKAEEPPKSKKKTAKKSPFEK